MIMLRGDYDICIRLLYLLPSEHKTACEQYYLGMK